MSKLHTSLSKIKRVNKDSKVLSGRGFTTSMIIYILVEINNKYQCLTSNMIQIMDVAKIS